MMKFSQIEQRVDDAGTAINRVCYAPNGDWLAGIGGFMAEPGSIVVWDARTGKRIANLAARRPLVDAIAVAPNGSLLATSCGTDDAVDLWDTGTWQRIATLPIFEPPYARNAVGLLVDKTRVGHLVFSHEGDSLLAGCSDGTAKWWDLKTGQRVVVANLRRNSVDLVGFIDNNAHIVAGTSFSLTVWDRGTATQLRNVPLDGNAAWLHVGPMPRPHMVSLGSQGAMLLWNTETWTCQRSFIRLPNRKFPTAIAYSPLSDLLAIGFGHGTVLIWSPEEQAVVGKLKCRDFVLSLAFSPVDRTLCVVTGAGEDRVTEYAYTLPSK